MTLEEAYDYAATRMAGDDLANYNHVTVGQRGYYSNSARDEGTVVRICDKNDGEVRVWVLYDSDINRPTHCPPQDWHPIATVACPECQRTMCLQDDYICSDCRNSATIAA